MTTLGDGLYTIRKAPELATLQSVKPGTDVVLRPASDDPREFPDQRWVVKKTPNGTHTIVNRENSLSFEGKPERHTRVRGYPNHPPREWVLYKAAEPNTYFVVVPGGPVDGKELAFDRSPLLIIPPFTELTYLNVEDQEQAWEFDLIVF
ncbi:hypothetical protein DFH94DRAFT_732202 [Russula ochroleuca]|uniref:Uncharacterized protein n=1 Tax=Russula ochroleuca TaxID=152965 RepID=A0A9P5MY98_9AGAM|nr:hypothetical protein DFH94DRAFT_732202 [Russula ochroleuca]